MIYALRAQHGTRRGPTQVSPVSLCGNRRAGEQHGAGWEGEPDLSPRPPAPPWSRCPAVAKPSAAEVLRRNTSEITEDETGRTCDLSDIYHLQIMPKQVSSSHLQAQTNVFVKCIFEAVHLCLQTFFTAYFFPPLLIIL